MLGSWSNSAWPVVRPGVKPYQEFCAGVRDDVLYLAQGNQLPSFPGVGIVGMPSHHHLPAPPSERALLPK